MNLKPMAIENELYLQFFDVKHGLNFIKTRDSKIDIMEKNNS